MTKDEASALRLCIEALESYTIASDETETPRCTACGAHQDQCAKTCAIETALAAGRAALESSAERA